MSKSIVISKQKTEFMKEVNLTLKIGQICWEKDADFAKEFTRLFNNPLVPEADVGDKYFYKHRTIPDHIFSAGRQLHGPGSLHIASPGLPMSSPTVLQDHEFSAPAKRRTHEP